MNTERVGADVHGLFYNYRLHYCSNSTTVLRLNPQTECWNAVRGRWKGFAGDEKEDNQSKKHSDLEVHFVSGLRGQEEAEERDGVDEQTGKDEVDDVEQTST